MKTDDLIDVLSRDAAPVRPVQGVAAVAACIGLAAAAAIFFYTMGPRPDFSSALETWRFSLKLAVVAGALALAGREYFRLMRPTAAVSLWPVWMVAGAMALAVLTELAVLPREEWMRAAIGHNASVCLRTIPFLSVFPLAASLWAMRAGAPSAPASAGAIAGGMSAAMGALFYATHCPDDSPLFVAIWYPIAAAMVIGAGALLGRYALRW